MLNAYLAATQNLLQNPGAPVALYTPANLTIYINTARSQLAGDSECIRLQAALSTINGTQVYGFSTVNTGSSASNGIAGVLNVRMITRTTVMLNTWPWEWFNRYFIAKSGVANAEPTDWAQYGQGVGGTLYFFPTPNAIYGLTLDCVCYPIPLVDDTTVEAIPFPWTDCVPYFAAYLALLSSQTSSRQADAARMFELYQEFAQRARRYSTPTVLPYQYEQSGLRMPVPAGGVMLGKGAQS